MRIDFDSLNPEGFLISKHEIGGEECTFVRPRPIFFDWDATNLHLRSSIWNSAGEPVSLSFKKFFNWQEKPAINPFPEQFENISIIEKLDGSTLIVSRYNGQTILRTRGTVDAHAMPNGDELPFFREKYGYFFSWLESRPINCTFLFEWVSPRNRIILPYAAPELFLIGCISHVNYSMSDQESLDSFAAEYGFRRPQRYDFSTPTDMLATIAALEDKEGVCVYYNGDQHIRKVKALRYLKLHAFKGELSLKNLVEVFYNAGLPDSKDSFLKLIEESYDFECAQAAKPILDELWVFWLEFLADLLEVELYVGDRPNVDQKTFAVDIQQKFPSHLCAAGFSMRKGTFKLSGTKKTFLEKYISKSGEEITPPTPDIESNS